MIVSEALRQSLVATAYVVGRPRDSERRRDMTQEIRQRGAMRRSGMVETYSLGHHRADLEKMHSEVSG